MAANRLCTKNKKKTLLSYHKPFLLKVDQFKILTLKTKCDCSCSKEIMNMAPLKLVIFTVRYESSAEIQTRRPKINVAHKEDTHSVHNFLAYNGETVYVSFLSSFGWPLLHS